MVSLGIYFTGAGIAVIFCAAYIITKFWWNNLRKTKTLSLPQNNTSSEDNQNLAHRTNSLAMNKLLESANPSSSEDTLKSEHIDNIKKPINDIIEESKRRFEKINEDRAFIREQYAQIRDGLTACRAMHDINSIEIDELKAQTLESRVSLDELKAQNLESRVNIDELKAQILEATERLTASAEIQQNVTSPTP